MAYDEIAEALIVPAGASERYKKLNALDRLLNGSFFDDIQYAFEQEKLGDQYLSLTKRRPSVKANLARIVMEQSSGSLWSDDEMAKIVVGIKSIKDAADTNDQKNVDAIFTDCLLDAVMMELYWKSASGSGAVILDFDPDTKMPTFQCVQGKYLRPHWSSKGSNKLDALEYVWDTTAKDLRALGTAIDPAIADNAVYWMRILYTAQNEIHYAALDAYHYQHLGEQDPDNNYKIINWAVKNNGVYSHRWGAVPAVYVRCLLFGETDDDGRCPYEDIADIQVEVSRLLSQVGRGFRYAADPLLVRERGEIGMATKGMASNGLDVFGGDEMRGAQGQTIRSVSNVLEGQAKLLEITGTGLQQATEYTDRLREWALETAGAVKATGKGGKSEMSGRALGMLSNMLAILVKQQRIAYGQRALLPLIRLLLTGCKNGVIDIEDVITPDPDTRLRLVWPKDSVDAEMLLEEHRARMHGLKIASGAEVPNDWRDEDGQEPLPGATCRIFLARVRGLADLRKARSQTIPQRFRSTISAHAMEPIQTARPPHPQARQSRRRSVARQPQAQSLQTISRAIKPRLRVCVCLHPLQRKSATARERQPVIEPKPFFFDLQLFATGDDDEETKKAEAEKAKAEADAAAAKKKATDDKIEADRQREESDKALGQKTQSELVEYAKLIRNENEKHRRDRDSARTERDAFKKERDDLVASRDKAEQDRLIADKQYQKAAELAEKRAAAAEAAASKRVAEIEAKAKQSAFESNVKSAKSRLREIASELGLKNMNLLNRVTNEELKAGEDGSVDEREMHKLVKALKAEIPEAFGEKNSAGDTGKTPAEIEAERAKAAADKERDEERRRKTASGGGGSSTIDWMSLTPEQFALQEKQLLKDASKYATPV